MSRVLPLLPLTFLLACDSAGIVNVPPGQPGPGGSASRAGTYVGNWTCTSELLLDGSVVAIDSWNDPVNITLTDKYLPVTDGEVARAGLTHEEALGPFTFDTTVTSAVTTANGSEVRQNATLVMGGDNSCRYAFDGVCDEPTYCPTATDLADCGPLVLDGLVQSVVQDAGPTQVRLTDMATFLNSTGAFTLNLECSGLASR